MEIIQITSLNDTFDFDVDLSTFEIRMPTSYDSVYIPRRDLEAIDIWITEFITDSMKNGYDYHEWYDYHLGGNIYEFNRED